MRLSAALPAAATLPAAAAILALAGPPVSGATAEGFLGGAEFETRVTGQTLPVDGGATTKAPLMYSEDTLAWSKQFSGGGLAPDAKRP